MRTDDQISATLLPPLPRKKPAVFHHPTLDMPLYDGLAMDLHAMTYAEACVAYERKRWSKLAAHVRCVAQADIAGALDTRMVRMMAAELDDVLGPNVAGKRQTR